MATRLIARKYIRSVIGETGLPATERECLEMLISSHRALRGKEVLRVEKAQRRTWFGRLLWRLFGRWL